MCGTSAEECCERALVRLAMAARRSSLAWRPNAAALCRAVAAERAMSGGGGRKGPRYVGWWRPNAAAPCRAVAAARGRTCRVALMGHGTSGPFHIFQQAY